MQRWRQEPVEDPAPRDQCRRTRSSAVSPVASNAGIEHPAPGQSQPGTTPDGEQHPVPQRPRIPVHRAARRGSARRWPDRAGQREDGAEGDRHKAVMMAIAATAASPNGAMTAGHEAVGDRRGEIGEHAGAATADGQQVVERASQARGRVRPGGAPDGPMEADHAEDDAEKTIAIAAPSAPSPAPEDEQRVDDRRRQSAREGHVHAALRIARGPQHPAKAMPSPISGFDGSMITGSATRRMGLVPSRRAP